MPVPKASYCLARTLSGLFVTALVVGGCGYNPQKPTVGDAGPQAGQGGTGGAGPDAATTSQGGADAAPGTGGTSSAGGNTETPGGKVAASGGIGGAAGTVVGPGGGTAGGPGGTGATAGAGGAGGSAGGPAGSSGSSTVPDAGVDLPRDVRANLDMAPDRVRDVAIDVALPPQDVCTPNCQGRCAGLDGCGGTCPNTCTSPQTCGGGGTPDVCGEPVCAQAQGTPKWQSLQPPGDSPANTAGCPLVLDSTRNRFLIFTRDAETWEYDPEAQTWTQRTPANAPSARWMHTMAFDSARNRMVLFGGSDILLSQFVNDTWEWDGSTWIRQVPATSPPVYFPAGLVYDPVRGRTYLVISSQTPGGSAVWEWNGNDWTNLKVTSPAWGASFGLVWDGNRKKLVALRLVSTSEPPGVWEWQYGESAWTRVAVGCTTFTERSHSPTVYVPGTGKVLFYGGVDRADKAMGDLWTWSPGMPTWQQYAQGTSAPATRLGSLAYYPTRGSILLLVGDGPAGTLDQMWTLTF